MRYRILVLAILLVGCQGTLDMGEEFADVGGADPDTGTLVQQPTSVSPDPAQPAATSSPDAGTDPDIGALPTDDVGTEVDVGRDMGQPDVRPEPGTIVEFRISEGTGTDPWNSREDPVVVYVGQILRIINEDSRDHQLHAGDEAAVDHGSRLVPGESQDLEVEQPMELGDNPRLYDHNIGRSAAFWLEARE